MGWRNNSSRLWSRPRRQRPCRPNKIGSSGWAIVASTSRSKCRIEDLEEKLKKQPESLEEKRERLTTLKKEHADALTDLRTAGMQEVEDDGGGGAKKGSKYTDIEGNRSVGDTRCRTNAGGSAAQSNTKASTSHPTTSQKATVAAAKVKASNHARQILSPNKKQRVGDRGCAKSQAEVEGDDAC